MFKYAMIRSMVYRHAGVVVDAKTFMKGFTNQGQSYLETLIGIFAMVIYSHRAAVFLEFTRLLSCGYIITIYIQKHSCRIPVR